MTWSSNDTRVNEETLFKLATYNLTEIVEKIYVRFIAAKDDGTINTWLQLDEESHSVKEQRHRKFGRCYTFDPEKYIRDLEVYYTRMYL